MLTVKPNADSPKSMLPPPHIAMFFLLCHIESPRRQALFPSNFTSKEYSRNSHTFMLTLDRIPPMVPASSPDEREYVAPLTIGISPSVFTVVGPPVASDALPMLG